MKVLNLRCSRDHAFEGWFGSEEDFQAQSERGLIECPRCADHAIQKLPSAPRLNLGVRPSSADAKHDRTKNSGNSSVLAEGGAAGPMLKREIPPSAPKDAGNSQGMATRVQAAMLQALRHVMASTPDVGAQFAEEARRMHYGEAEARNIRGQASPREVVELLEEGIEVLPLPMLPALKETLH